MTLKLLYDSIREFKLKDSKLYEPNINDRCFFKSFRGSYASTSFLDIHRDDSSYGLFPLGDAHNLLKLISDLNLSCSGNEIFDIVITSEGVIKKDEFKLLKESFENLPKPIDYELFIGQKIATKNLSDEVYFSESGDIYFHFTLNSEIMEEFPMKLDSRRYSAASIGKRFVVQVMLNHAGLFEAIATPRQKQSTDKFIEIYPNYKLDDGLVNFKKLNQS